MLNMLKMDLYRMFRTKSLYIIWIIMAVALIYTTQLLSLDYETIHQTGQETTADEEEMVNIGISVTLPTDPKEEVTVYDVMYANAGGEFLGLFIVIFAVLFSTADMNSGYVKNIAGQVKNRGNLIFSKAAVLMLFVIMTICGTMVIQMMSNYLVFGNLELGNVKEFCLYMGTQTMLHCALALIVMAISIILRNNVASMVIALCLTMNVMTIIYSGIDKFVAKLGVKDFAFSEYTVTSKIAMLPMEMTFKDSAEGIAISAIFIIITTGIAAYVFKKRDI